MQIADPDFTFDVPLDFAFEEPAKGRTVADATGVMSRSIRDVSPIRRFYDLRKVPHAEKLIQPLPARGETIHAVMGGDFNAWDLVPAVQSHVGCVSELIVTTLGFNHSNNEHLCELLDAGAVRRAWVLCSEYFKSADPDVYAAAQDKFSSRNARISAARNHSKIVLIAPENTEDRFVFESSANLRSCNNLEQFTLTNAPNVFEFHREWILSLFP